MFSAFGLFRDLPCPEKESCIRPNCLFSHDPSVKEVPVVRVPVDTPKAASTPARASQAAATTPVAGSSRGVVATPRSVPAKRPVGHVLPAVGSSNGQSGEPPKKFQRVGTTSHKPSAAAASSIGAVSSHDLCLAVSLTARRMARQFYV